MFCKQHVQIVSAKRSNIRQRHRMRGLGHKSARSPHRRFRCWRDALAGVPPIIELVPDIQPQMDIDVATNSQIAKADVGG
jgi:hypothetical protein